MEQSRHLAAHARGGTRHATRVADVLLAFLDNPGTLSVTDVAHSMQVSKSVVHRVLSALASRALVQRLDDGRYRLGDAGRALGAEGLRYARLLEAGRPVLRRLQVDTSETATLAVRLWDRRVHLEQILSTHAITMRVELGRAYPLHAGATGKAILAFAPDETRERILAGTLPAITRATTTDPDTLRAELERIRADRVATSAGERQVAARSVAAPILDAHGVSLGAVTVCGPASRFTDATAQALRARVRDDAAELSRCLADGRPAAVR